MDRSVQDRSLALAALVLVGVGLAAVVALQVIEWRLDPFTTYLSDYEATPFGGLLYVTYLTMGFGSVLLAFVVRRRAGASRPLATGSVLLGIAGILVLTFAAWPQGFVHLSLVRASQGILLVGIGFLAVGFRARRGWSAFELLSWAIVALAALGLARAEQLFAWPGLIQRAYFSLTLVWIALLARTVFVVSAPAARSSAGP